MKIDLDILNRMGIILNFLAVFMLTSALIGKKRLLKIESKLKLVLEKNFFYLKEINAKNLNKIADFKDYRFTISFLLLIFFFTLLLKLLKIYFFSQSILISFLMFAVLTGINFILVNKTAKIILKFSITCLKHIEKQLEDNERFLSYLTFLGLIIFIIGNVLQFIAS